MLQITNKNRKGLSSPQIKAGLSSPHDFVFGSGAPDLETSIQAAAPLLDTTVYVPLSAYYEGNGIRGKENLKQKLINRARSKYVTGLVAVPLSKLVSPLQKQYLASLKCAGALVETPGKLTSLYCNSRWCLVCSRIRTSKMIAGYLPAIEAMPEKWFLTLSRPNVKKAKLEAERRLYISNSQLIVRNLREKLKLDFSFIRKLECTYNAEDDTYHPHFHLIIDSEVAAQSYLDCWLQRFPTAKLNKGNQLKKADNNSAAELFKYFTKVVSKSKTGNPADYQIHLSALDTMFVALRGARTFQAGGLIKTISEDIEPTDALESGRFNVDFWQWNGRDWLSRDTADVLTGYTPSDGIRDISNHLVYPAGVPLVADSPSTPIYVDKVTGEVVPNENAHLAAKLPQAFALVRGELHEKAAPVSGGGFPPLPASTDFMPFVSEPAPARLVAAPAGYRFATSAAGLVLLPVAGSDHSAERTMPVPVAVSSCLRSIGGKKPMGLPAPDL